MRLAAEARGGCRSEPEGADEAPPGDWSSDRPSSARRQPRTTGRTARLSKAVDRAAQSSRGATSRCRACRSAPR
jgi:hypothetical protein